MSLTSPEYRIRMGTILLVYCMVVTFLDGFNFYEVNEGIIITLVGFASGLLSVGIIKQHKSFRDG